LAQLRRFIQHHVNHKDTDMENTTQDSCARQRKSVWTLADLAAWESLRSTLDRFGYLEPEPFTVPYSGAA
jgi:hypothetical protein